MTFDPTSLLQAPAVPPPPPMTVDALAARLAQLSEMGLGGADIVLPEGQAIAAVKLVAIGEVAAHCVVVAG